ncbi:hypothetical protein LguiB_001495 [Lonicera macranthoides]
MARKLMASSILGLAMIILALTGRPANAVISCTEAITRLLPCEPYLVGFSDISVPCCEAAASLNQQASTKDDRKALCQCFKETGPGLGVKEDRAKQLPQLCNINVPVPIDLNVNCDT